MKQSRPTGDIEAGSGRTGTIGTIGALAALAQCSVPTIRYYEEIGLLPQARRTGSGHRYYGETDVRRLGFIKRCRDFGFPIEQVKQLADLFDHGDRACSEVRELAQHRLDDVRARLNELRQLEASLAGFVDSCNRSCSDGATRDCAIVENLRDAPASSGCVSSGCSPSSPGKCA